MLTKNLHVQFMKKLYTFIKNYNFTNSLQIYNNMHSLIFLQICKLLDFQIFKILQICHLSEKIKDIENFKILFLFSLILKIIKKFKFQKP